MKSLLPEVRSTAGIVRFVDEIRALGRLEHPSITPIHDVGVDASGRLFFTMKYVDGQTLSDAIAHLQRGDADAHARLPVSRRLDIFASVLQALAYAHQRQVLHRDIKPDNIMLGSFGEVLLMDWGIARPIGSGTSVPAPGSTGSGQRAAQTIVGTVIGTPAYMSPEQARGETETLDGRSDGYSAFVTLFELLTLQAYVADGTVEEVLARVIQKEPPSPSSAVWNHPTQRTVPVEFRHFLRKGLAREPKDRFQTVEEALEELAALRSGRIPVRCPVSAVKRTAIQTMWSIEQRPWLGPLLLVWLLLPIALAAALLVAWS
jgi:serine/threonine-protein kinase